jgi:hypothetical protein
MITQEQLQSILNYDQNTGLFTWIKNNKKAGSPNKCGYIHIGINNKSYKAHRLAWLYVYGRFPLDKIDHINNIKDDNRLCNLRECTQQQNCLNSKMKKSNTSGVKGLNWHKKHKKWNVRVSLNKKRIELGLFNDFFEACCTAFSYRNKFHGEFVNHL